MARVLIIDDEEPVRYTLRAVLEASGHDVDTAVNGLDGISTFRAQPVDLVITDIMMPVQEGIETITQLCQLAPEVKIIAMSGGRFAKLDFLKFAQRLGAKEVLRKPINPHDLINAVNRVIG